ncbi:MAG: hypothetical protein NDJ89_15150 [Oligoflexia bacterium]|nr:hypothetical protein [Oligoflexia bacterium]
MTMTSRRLLLALCFALVALWAFAAGWRLGTRATPGASFGGPEPPEPDDAAADYRAERAPEQPLGLGPFARPTPQAASALIAPALRNVPLAELKRVYELRLEELEKNSVTRLFWRPSNPRERLKHAETLVNLLQVAFQGDSHFSARAAIPELALSIALFAAYLPVRDFSEASSDSAGNPMADPESFSWTLIFYVVPDQPPSEKKRAVYGTDLGTPAGISLKEDRYFLLLPVLNLEPLARRFSHLAAEIPLGDPSAEQNLELHETQAGRWKKFPLRWERISREEAEASRRALYRQTGESDALPAH